jgi:hypothetical protein
MARDVTFEFDPPMVTSKSYMDIYELKAFEEGISTLPPGKEFRTLLDFGPPRYEEKLPDFYRVKVNYRGDPGNRTYAEEMDLDFGLYWNRRYITLRDIHDVHKQLETIAKEMQRWRPGIGSGLLAVVPRMCGSARTRRSEILRSTTRSRPGASRTPPKRFLRTNPRSTWIHGRGRVGRPGRRLELPPGGGEQSATSSST